MSKKSGSKGSGSKVSKPVTSGSKKSKSNASGSKKSKPIVSSKSSSQTGPTVDEIEKAFNLKVKEYNCYDDYHPMIGVSWSEKQDTYIVRYAKAVNTKSKILESACEKIKDAIASEIEHFADKNDAEESDDDAEIIENEKDDLEEQCTFKEEKDFVRVIFQYEDIYFITYAHENKPYFDIRHIISLLDLHENRTTEKYTANKNRIIFRYWFMNEFEGYLLRELIDSGGLYAILLNSNSKFGKTFKQHVEKILVELTNKGCLSIGAHGIELKKDALRENYSKMETATAIVKYSYENSLHFNCMYEIVMKGSRINLSMYLKKHVIYAFLVMATNVIVPYMIIKFGYTHDIVTRIGSLGNEYEKSKFVLLGIRFVESEEDEKKFHEYLRKRYPSMPFEMEINGRKKTELYYFNPCLMDEFDGYRTDLNNTVIVTTLTEEAKKVMELLSIELDNFINSATTLIKNDPDYVRTIIKMRHERSLEMERQKTIEMEKELIKEQKEVQKLRHKNNLEEMKIIKMKSKK